jgi:hypothetical protein
MKSLLLAIPLLLNQCSAVDYVAYWREPPPPVWEQVYEDVRDLSDERHRPGQDWELQVAPGFPSDHLDAVVALYGDAISFWSGAFDFPQTVPLTVMGENDRDWWESVTTQESPPFRDDYNLYDAGWFGRSASKKSIGMVGTDHLGMPHIVTVVGSEVDFGYSGAFSAPLVARHETTHWFQYVATGSMTEKCTDWKMALFLGFFADPDDPRIGDTNGMACPWLSMPCWLSEGHAELYTIPFGLDSETLRSLRIWQIKNRTEDGLLRVLNLTRHNLTTGDQGCTREAMYSVGLLVNEKLFYDFGDEKINEFWLAINQPSSSTNPSWEIAFDETFGVSAEDWYETSAIPYLLGVFDD